MSILEAPHSVELQVSPIVSLTLAKVRELVSAGNLRISEHGYDELAEDRIYVRDIIAGVGEAIVVEDYPNFPKGPSVLVLQQDSQGHHVHAVWGIPRGHEGPAVLVTAYRPDPSKWTADFLRRRNEEA